MPTKISKTAAAAALGRAGGRAGTKAQNRARQANAKQGAGRPGRVCSGCGEAVHGGHKDKRQDARCGARSWRWRQKAAGPFTAPGAAERAELLAAITLALETLRAHPEDATRRDASVLALEAALGRAAR